MKDKIMVLIVDDEERFRLTTAKILRRRGFEAKAVGSGPEAIAQIKSHEIDIVVLDVKMPGMDGHEVLQKIVKLKPNLPVIMLTGHASPESAADGLSNGVVDYLTKPCSIDLLARKINEAFAVGGKLSEEEPRVRHIMIPLESFSMVKQDNSVAEAVKTILQSFTYTMTTSTVHESVHRSVLVLDQADNVTGVITLADLLRGMQPPFTQLFSRKPETSSASYMSYSGMFTVLTRDLAKKNVSDIMSDVPPIIDADDNLMQAVDMLTKLGLTRLLVRKDDTIIGIIREQDLFFEIANIIRKDTT